MRKKIKLNENFISAIGNEPFDFTDFIGRRTLEDTQRQLPEGTKLEVVKDLPYEDIEGIRYMFGNPDGEIEDERLSSLSDIEIIKMAKEKGFKFNRKTQEFIIPKGSILTAYHTDEHNSMGFYFDFNGLNLSMFISPDEDKEILMVKLFEEPLKEDVESLGNETLLSILIEENDYIAGREFTYNGINYHLFIEADYENGWSLEHSEKVFDADKIKLVLVELLLEDELLFSDTVKPEETLASVATYLLSLIEKPLKEDVESDLYIYQFPASVNNLFGEFKRLCDEKKVSILGKDKSKEVFVKGTLEAIKAVAHEIEYELVDEYLSKEADFNMELVESIKSKSLKEAFSKQDAEKYVKDITQKLFDEGEFYDIWANDEVIEAQIVSGDWKHDHLKFKAFIQKYFDDLGVEIVIDSEVEDGTTEDDVYTATYFIKAMSKDEVKEALKKELPSEEDIENWIEDSGLIREYVDEFVQKLVEYLKKKGFSNSSKPTRLVNALFKAEKFSKNSFETYLDDSFSRAHDSSIGFKESVTEDAKLDTVNATTLEDALKKADELFRTEKPFAVVYGYYRKPNINADAQAIYLDSPLVAKTQEKYSSLAKMLVSTEKFTRDNHVRITGLITLFNPIHKG